jgi:L-2-hydroxyglutarate oxidase
VASSSDIVVIGGGLVGLATAHAIASSAPEASITVVEAEDDVARHQSGRNSGVLHSGVYYAPGSHKASMCTDGRRRMEAFCDEHGVAWKRTGKLIIATRPEEVGQLDALLARGRANGLEGLEIVDEAGIRAIEPHATGLAALVVPQAGIVDYTGVAHRLVDLLRASGNTVETGFRVTSIRRSADGYHLASASGAVINAGYLVNCAGLQSDRIARMAGADPSVQIVPFRGEYYVLDPSRADLVRSLVYPVPDPRFPFLGVHFTRRIDGSVEVGPNAVLAFGRHHYRGEGGANFRDSSEMARSRALWTLGRTYWRTGSKEAIRSKSKRLYARAAKALIPEVEASDLRKGGSGIRAQALRADGALVDDFALEQTDRALHVLNAPSPAATACLSIGQEIADRVLASAP